MLPSKHGRSSHNGRGGSERDTDRVEQHIFIFHRTLKCGVFVELRALLNADNETL
jgi:hypothetical protein